MQSETMIGRGRGAALAARLGRDRRGSNSVEFALLAPVLLLLVLGGAYLALYLGTAHALSQIAADTARHAMIGETAEERRALAETWAVRSGEAYPVVDMRRLSVGVSETDGLLSVRLAYDISYLPLPTIVRRLAMLPRSLVRVSAVATR